MSIEKDWLADFGDENPITKILKLSYDNLPAPSVKKCFAYCSIICRALDGRRIIQSLDGNGIFNLLLQNSLLQVSERDGDDNVMDCNMHGLVYDLAFSILYKNDNVIDGVCQRRYIGYKPSGDGLLSIPTGQERYVRTLFFDGKVSDIMFEDFKSLRTFTFVGREYIRELPSSITKLKHLRYLDISRTRINYLSDSFGELYHLQTLRADNSFGVVMDGYCLEKLPDSMSCLISLRHLHIPGKTTLPQGIGKLTSLETLPYFCVGSKNGPGISELGNLKDLKGKLEIDNLEHVRHKNEAICADLLGKAGIYESTLRWDKYKKGDEANDESVLEGLIFEVYGLCCVTTYSSIMKCDVDIMKDLDGNICSAVGPLCEKQCTMGIFWMKVMKKYQLPGIFSHELRLMTNLPIEMVCAPSLERLILNNVSSITNMGMMIVCLHKMTSLISLSIYDVPRFSIVNTLNGSLSNNSLRYLSMGPFSLWNNNVSLNESVGAMLLQCISLRHLVLTGMEHWECLPDQLQHLTSLEELDLRDFGIEALPEWFGNLESLTVLILPDCEKLIHLPSKQAMQRLSKLTILSLCNCPLLLKENRSNNEYDDDDDDEVPEIVDSEWPKISHIPTVYVNNHLISSDNQGRN
ncbi:hypothetical protein CASFOL_012434 [Castilleja foliolosa]|uniref:Uncharacterized protein n=1 Tax=Castilleja foliolosa TaxID=1961234 RepID=A0ABD3DKS5_9LAMI